jgi:UDP-N-acetylglucosamine 2-epimerase (non-hydrolysing)
MASEERAPADARLKVVLVAGARPNFMKIAPLMEALSRRPQISTVLVHTGQHYDRAMSESFFEDLGIPKPDINLEVGSGSQNFQTGAILQKFEPVLERERPDLVVVVGDVTSTVACALAAARLGVAVAHVEAGLRSFDRRMPEEINRVVTDAIADLLLVSEEGAIDNLLREGIPRERIHFVGNVMIDTLMRHREKAARSDVLARLGLEGRRYSVLTLHRPSNVDDPAVFVPLVRNLEEVARRVPIVFPCHPRTRSRIEGAGLSAAFRDAAAGGVPERGIHLVPPLGYLEFLHLMSRAAAVLTDSGGIQEETTILGVPCLTLRENTERPVTVDEGTNVLVGRDFAKVHEVLAQVLAGTFRKGRGAPRLWDGRAAERIVDAILALHARRTAPSRAAASAGAG